METWWQHILNSVQNTPNWKTTSNCVYGVHLAFFSKCQYLMLSRKATSLQWIIQLPSVPPMILLCHDPLCSIQLPLYIINRKSTMGLLSVRCWLKPGWFSRITMLKVGAIRQYKKMDCSDCFPQGSAVSIDSESERRGKQGGRLVAGTSNKWTKAHKDIVRQK